MTVLAGEQIEALRDLGASFSDAEVVLVGATALACYVDMEWRKTKDLDVAVSVDIDSLPEQMLPGWVRSRPMEHRWTSAAGVTIDIIPAGPDRAAGARAHSRGNVACPDAREAGRASREGRGRCLAHRHRGGSRHGLPSPVELRAHRERTTRGKIERICRAAGFEPPVLCAPEELIEE